VVDLRALAECVQDMAMGNLAGARRMVDAKALAPGLQYSRPGSAAEARHKEVAEEYLQRAGDCPNPCLGRVVGSGGPRGTGSTCRIAGRTGWVKHYRKPSLSTRSYVSTRNPGKELAEELINKDSGCELPPPRAPKGT